MTELFRYLVGTCSLYFCSFGVIHNPDGSWLRVSAYDLPAEVIETEYFDLEALGFDVVEIIWRKEK